MSPAYLLIAIAWIGQCTKVSPSNHILVHFEDYEFPLNNADLWNVSTTMSGSRSITTACTTRFSNLCIEFNDDISGFKVLFEDKQFAFANDSDWTHIDAVYPVESMKHLRRRLTMRDDDFYGNYDDTYGYGYGYGVGGMFLRGLNGHGMYGGGMYGHGMHGRGMYGGFSPYGMYGGHHRRKSKIDKYLDDGGQFGKMGFPSLSGNMMGVVQSSHGMAPFQMMPPSIHINADFRRLLGISSQKVDYDSMTGLVLKKCAITEHAEICGVYNMTDFSIGVSLTMYNRSESGYAADGNNQMDIVSQKEQD